MHIETFVLRLENVLTSVAESEFELFGYPTIRV